MGRHRLWSFVFPLALLSALLSSCAGSRQIPEYDLNDQALKYKGRIWQKSGSDKLLNWFDAKAYCQNLEIGRYTDWRLPTEHELSELVVCTEIPREITKGIMGTKDCEEDVDHTGKGLINPIFTLQKTKNSLRVWQSTYWTGGGILASASDSTPYLYYFVPFLKSHSFNISGPSKLHFVRCIHGR